MTQRKIPKSIDEYISAQPLNIQPLLEQIRQAIRESAPDAEETISYQMPAFKQNGILVWFGAFKNHIGFFPKVSAMEAFKEQLKPYKTSKGTVQFQINKPVPLDLIKEIVRFRVREESKEE